MLKGILQQSCCALVMTLLTVQSFAETRPKVGLVLSGGGARGAAHIGVIEALEELQIPIDFIVGTSMGAVIGGLYAAGIPIDTIKQDFTTLDWDQIFSTNIARKELYYRRKLDTDIFLLKNFISYSNGKIHIPYGIITGQSLYATFNSYLMHEEPVVDFNHLSIPFKAVATDLITGHAVVLDKGDLPLSMLASMAVPGIISPIDVNGYMLVDGGVSCNLPIEIAKQMGADVVIAVDVSTPLYTKTEIIDLTGVLGQITNMLTYKNMFQSKSDLSAKDILITPKLEKIETAAFDDFAKAIEPGYCATMAERERLAPLAMTPFPPRVTLEQSNFNITEVVFINSTGLPANIFHHYVKFDNPIVEDDEIQQKVDELYGLSIFDRVYYGIEKNDIGDRLVIVPKKGSNDPIYFQGSILLDTDFQETNHFGLVLGVTNQQINDLLGEVRFITQIGYGETVFAEYYQPLESSLSWFINPSAGIQRTPFIGYYDFDAVATYLVTNTHFEFDFGRTFANVVQLRSYWEYDYYALKLRTGCYDEVMSLVDSPFDEHIPEGRVGVALAWDTLDNVYFPHHGVKGVIDLNTNQKAFGGESQFSQLSIRNLAAVSKGKHAVTLGTLYNRTIENTPTFTSKYSLGGLYELTGLSSNELNGDNSALFSVIYFYEFKKLNIIPNRPLPIYTGFSLEAGKVWGDVNVSNNHFRESGSLFIAADSILGPIYLAFGATDNGRKAVHLMLRPAFR